MSASAQANNPRLTVAMIARDAELSITATLDSIREIADEIIVADTGSIDRTRQIAAARATHVVSVPWADDFAAARNACLKHVTGDWVLWLDAGETVTPQTAEEIRRFVDEDADRQHAYLMVVRLPAMNENMAGEQVGRIRLVPNLEALRFIGRVRETMQPAIAALGLSVEPMSWVIHRDPANHRTEIKNHKARRDLKLAELQIRDRGPAASPLIAMGEAWSNLGESRQAIDCFRRALQYTSRGTTEMLEIYYGLLAAHDGFDVRPGEVVGAASPTQPAMQAGRSGQTNHRDIQIQTCLEGLDIFPYDAQLLCAMANYLQNLGRVDLASRSYQAAMEHGHVNLETWHLVAIREVAVTCLSLALEQLGQDDEARRVLTEVLSIESGSARMRRRLIELCIKHDLRREALDHVALLSLDPADVEALRTAVRGACLAAKNDWPSARAYLQTAYDAGCRDLICLRWLAVALVSSGEYQAAEPILQEWLAAAPTNVEAQKYAEAISARVGSRAASAAFSPTSDPSRQYRVDAASPPNLNLYPQPTRELQRGGS